ncbi:hypothetical protein SAMN05660653_01566 [Desulfonatronum thiosulfatophilum]|uniref:Uncharacterized protein n=1 Tax=Desulfonatronum thiosulfatophilum TaxID=617002 RepID=A0A1G6CIZ5_9BACT|nr:hypothetical protein SAMN05660653_01566 [Desulfonatronum thiosulfatophilum]
MDQVSENISVQFFCLPHLSLSSFPRTARINPHLRVKTKSQCMFGIKTEIAIVIVIGIEKKYPLVIKSYDFDCDCDC